VPNGGVLAVRAVWAFQAFTYTDLTGLRSSGAPRLLFNIRHYGKAYQQQVLRAGAQLSARPEERQTG
jgi:hypothetical protein